MYRNVQILESGKEKQEALGDALHNKTCPFKAYMVQQRLLNI